jgi:hypothetical protein
MFVSSARTERNTKREAILFRFRNFSLGAPSNKAHFSLSHNYQADGEPSLRECFALLREEAAV